MDDFKDWLENVLELLVFVFSILFSVIALFGIVIGGILFLMSINHLEMGEVQDILSDMAGQEVVIVRHTEIGWRGVFHEVTLQLEIDGETFIAKCKNEMAGDTICFYYPVEDSQIVTIW